MAKLRLHQFLSKTGVFTSKKEILDAIHGGVITLNDRVTTDAQFQFNPAKFVVAYRKKVLLMQTEQVYIALNKPTGVICSRLNSQEIALGKQSVFDLISPIDPVIEKTLICVGRLDEDTTGLLLLTNDGDYCHRVIHPNKFISKVYEVTLENELTVAQRKALEAGVIIELEEDGIVSSYQTRPCRIGTSPTRPRDILIEIDEGKKRQIRRMFESVGNKVVTLNRASIGSLTLESLRLSAGSFVVLEKKSADLVFE